VTVRWELPCSRAPSIGKIELVKVIFLEPNSAARYLGTYLQELSDDTYFMSRGNGGPTSIDPQYRGLNCSQEAPGIAKGFVYPGQGPS
jgi:hypothetical protein